tara:strand:- start:1363 stop:3153 length:1791 start_codon:yes stop_codon:yes gene_type:complete
MKKYPKEYLEEIKLRLKVSQVVGKTIQLKRRGKEFIGLSPFKNEKTPSFTVSDEKGFYHCFSTGEHGNIFDFLMKTQSIKFGEAVKNLAAEAGMQPYRFTKIDDERDKRFNIYKKIYEKYNSFGMANLFKKENILALDYLLKKRKLTKKIIEEFKIGFIPRNNNFYEELKVNFNEKEIQDSGLYYQNEKTKKFIDRFNSRIIFPINSIAENPIAFGGRAITNEKIAKYINSPETEFYKKGRHLYNLDKAKKLRSETNEVIIVEGYMDVISLYQNGIKNVISNSGTAITESQINLIWNFFSDPIICLDGDKSGQDASLRISERLIPLISSSKKIFFSILPEGSDPDDYIKKNEKKGFQNFLEQKDIIQDYIWKLKLNKINPNNPFEVSKFEKDIKKICYTIQDETLKKYIYEEFLRKLDELIPKQKLFKKNNNFKGYYSKNVTALNETKKIFKKNNKYTKEDLQEFSILFIMLNYPDIVKKNYELISGIHFSSEKTRNLKKKIMENIDTDTNSNDGKNFININKNLIEEISDNCNVKMILVKKNKNDVEEIFKDLIKSIREIEHQKKIESFENKLINNMDESSFNELIKLKTQLNRD